MIVNAKALTLANLGFAYDCLGDYHRAIEFHEQHLSITREIGDRRNEDNALGNTSSRAGIGYL